jgi:hypothetical protein
MCTLSSNATRRTSCASTFLLLLVLCAILTACSDEPGPVQPSTDVQRDTTDIESDTMAVILRTPLMYCPFNTLWVEDKARDTFTITGIGFERIHPFKIRLKRIDGASNDELLLFDNDDPKTAFWFNDRMISTMRWIPKGTYRVEIIDARTHRLLHSVLPDLEVRSLQLRPLSKTTYDAGDRIKLTTVFPWGYTNVRGRPEYPSPRISAWIGDQQLKTTYIPREYSPGTDPLYDVNLSASVPGTGRIRLIDSSINEEALGPIITINAVPYTKYVARATLEWDHTVTWTDTTVRSVGSSDTSVAERTLRDTIHASIRRGCCDTITRGDTTKLTNEVATNDRWQAVIVVDVDRTLCRSIHVWYFRQSSSYYRPGWSASSEGVWLKLADVPVTVLADGSWLIELDAPGFATHVSELSLTTSQSYYGEDGNGSSTRSVGAIQQGAPMRFRMLLHAQ